MYCLQILCKQLIFSVLIFQEEIHHCVKLFIHLVGLYIVYTLNATFRQLCLMTWF
ncbi:hypothetical protein MTsPCn5_22430 [Croceitalea sp. MTPC5]|nr:hypothetical protein MTsPCn5_22430 [Croceitalea sp. MTPC5]